MKDEKGIGLSRPSFFILHPSSFILSERRLPFGPKPDLLIGTVGQTFLSTPSSESPVVYP